MAGPWLLFLLSVAARAQSRPRDANDVVAGSGALGPTAVQASAEPGQEAPGRAWGMGSLTVPLAVKRSRIGRRLVAGKREADLDGAAGPLVLPIEHRQVPRLVKRTDGQALEQVLQPRSDIAYYTTLQFGSPPQKIQVLVDTGSSELWINADCATSGSASEQAFCGREVGRYDASKSTTSTSNGEKSGVRYGSGSVNFTYFTDDVGLPRSRPMKAVKFGVATSSAAMSSGILGMAAGNGVTTKYNNFIDQLANQGLTLNRSYGMALGLKGEGGGSVTFGGVDLSKFVGRLKPQAIIPPRRSPDGFPRFWVQLESVSHRGPGDRGGRRLANSTMPVILDTGSTLALLPPGLVGSMAAALDAGRADQTGLRPVPCAMVNRPGSFDFGFDGVTIRVPYREMIRQLPAPSGVGGGGQLCYLGVMESNSLALLGDTFLRSAYAVFDIDGNSVLLAQYANCGTTTRTAASSDFPNMRGRCRQQDLAPSVRLAADEGGEANDSDNNNDNNRKSAASGRPAPTGTRALAAAVGVALVLAWAL